MTSDDQLRAALHAALPEGVLESSPYARAMYRRDASILKAEPLAVALPHDLQELRQVVSVCRSLQISMVPRGAGTGIAAGAVPGGAPRPPLVVGLQRIDYLTVDPEQRTARVGPGVVNLELDRQANRHGLRFAPDPSSQISCTIGGNIATNAGGAHCLAYGVTSQHVLSVDLLDAEGELHRFGVGSPENNGYDLRGLTVGSEGTFGFVVEAVLQLLPLPPAVETMVISFPTIGAAAEAVTAVLNARCLPAAMELMDRGAVALTEAYAQAGWDTDAAAVLLLEFEGLPHQVTDEVAVALAAARRYGGHNERLASDPTRRAELWKGRKAVAGAIAKVVPDYYLHDVVVPRSQLARSLEQVLAIAAEQRLRVINVFHAGDGNLHPLLLIDRTEPDIEGRLLAAGRAIIELAIAAGGSLTGEHGVGLEKRDFLCEVMEPEELELQWRVREAMDPTGRANPGKVLPTPHSCADLTPSLVPAGAWL
jgi:glycolate oxidase